ncbi:MAG: DNA repair protein RecO [Lachnospiraceae bacterium]|nr:DNA repair protein RecO [Lachnospiraceae bacterium]
MSSNYEVTGMVLSSVPAGEYDRRVEILTRERGRISGFATGARRPGSPVMAAAQPFVFGTFVISEGRTSNKIREARVDNFFAGLRKDVSGSLYGTYFMEVLQYVTRENNDETALLMLAYQTLRALESDAFDNRLVRAVFEIKTIMIEGEYPGPRRDTKYLDATLYTLDFLFRTAPARVYTFSVKPEVLEELGSYARWLCKRTWDHRFQSLEILELLA